jgi:hypothetical protein
LALTNPILARTAAAGAIVYAETVFPVAGNDQIAIPSGTYVQGQIDSMTRPGIFTPHAQFQIHFTKIVFANGYVVELPRARTRQAPAQPAAAGAPGTPPAFPADVIPAVATPYVEVSPRSDVLLDNGSQIEMVLQVPLRLNAAKVADAARQSSARPPDTFKSATRCRPIPGTPGTPDTVVPGTPGTPGTPDTVIPGVNGAPDVVIPGTPATPGTPDTVISGSMATPGIPCPDPPVVNPNPKLQAYSQTFHLDVPVEVSGKKLSPGNYRIAWKGSAPSVETDIQQSRTLLVSVPARFVLLNGKAPADAAETLNCAGGSAALRSLRFAGQAFALYFD